MSERDSLGDELPDHDVEVGEDQVCEDDREDGRHPRLEGIREHQLAERTDSQRGERDGELHRGDEARRVSRDPQHVARAAVALVVELDDARPACRDEAVFGRDEEAVQQDENADGEEFEEQRHAPTPGALVLGGISSSNCAAV